MKNTKQSCKQLERLHGPRITALIHGPLPPRLILNRHHSREMRKHVIRLNRAIPKAERQARTGDPARIRELIRLRVYQQGFEVLSLPGMFSHSQAHPESTEELRVWECLIGNRDRIRRLREALSAIRNENNLATAARCDGPTKHKDPNTGQEMTS